jgi:protein-arginine kinase activator protein McsA
MDCCAECGRQASLEIERDGEPNPLCAACADGLVPGLRVGSLALGLRPRHRESSGVCPHCGWTSQAIEETGLAGCPLCYEVFDRRIWKKYGITDQAPAGA